jgi:hypothetical protein
MKISNASILFWLLAARVAPTFVTAQFNCDPGSLAYRQWPDSAGGNGHLYGLVHDPQYWTQARVAAESLSICSGAVQGHLATLTTDDEDTFVSNLIPDPYIYPPIPWDLIFIPLYLGTLVGWLPACSLE